MNPVADPGELATLFRLDPETHLYGLADLEEPFWSASTWYHDADAAAGLVSLGDDWVTGYAMSRVDPEGSLRLLGAVQHLLPPNTWVTGPIGLAEYIGSRIRAITPKGAHWRMILDNPDRLGSDPGVMPLGGSDVDALRDLHSSDPGQTFWHPTMLAGNAFVGIWEGDRLVASAGTHVASETYGVAAIGAVITRPSHRGRGLGSAVVSALCRLLWGRYPTIGLNVEVSNSPALALYDGLGFRRAFQYEEIELL